MSAVAPLNASIRVCKGDGSAWVEKTYHRTFTARAEAQAYERLGEVVADVPGVRPARVLGVEEEANLIRVEYVPGPTLQEELRDRGGIVLDQWNEQVVQLLVSAYRQGVALDSDPSNILVPPGESGLCVIDPITQEMGLRHETAAMFLWGLLKYRLRDPRWWHYRGMGRAGRTLLDMYCAETGCDRARVQKDIGAVIRRAASWNREENELEGALTQWARRYLIASGYEVLALAIPRL